MADTKTNITVQLTGTDGNIFCVIANRKRKIPPLAEKNTKILLICFSSYTLTANLPKK